MDGSRLSLDELTKIQHYDELRDQYIVERDMRAMLQNKLWRAEAVLAKIREKWTERRGPARGEGANKFGSLVANAWLEQMGDVINECNRRSTSNPGAD